MACHPRIPTRTTEREVRCHTVQSIGNLESRLDDLGRRVSLIPRRAYPPKQQRGCSRREMRKPPHSNPRVTAEGSDPARQRQLRPDFTRACFDVGSRRVPLGTFDTVCVNDCQHIRPPGMNFAANELVLSREEINDDALPMRKGRASCRCACNTPLATLSRRELGMHENATWSNAAHRATEPGACEPQVDE